MLSFTLSCMRPLSGNDGPNLGSDSGTNATCEVSQQLVRTLSIKGTEMGMGLFPASRFGWPLSI